MLVMPFVIEGLGNTSYLIVSEDAAIAAAVDPERNVDGYIEAARQIGVRIVLILETHLHADFVSGSRELAAKTGARIVASAAGELAFDHQPVRDGDQIMLGDLTIRVLETPGHSPEHISFTVTEPGRAETSALFSGGSLIVGGAARTDLLGHEQSEPLARSLYHTLHDKLLHLPDHVSVYPTHGAGSFCVAPQSSQRVTTIGRERQSNALLQPQTEDEFVTLALSGLPSYPLYFRHMRAINQRGPRLLADLPPLRPLTPEQVQDWLAQEGTVLDVRPASAFADAHIPGSYSIALNAPLVTWAGWLIPFGTPLVLVSDGPFDRVQAVRDLLRIGYDDLRGYLEGGLTAWKAAGLSVERAAKISVEELHGWLQDGSGPLVLDVRQDSEWEAGHIPGAVHIENGRLPYDPLSLPTDRPIAVHCQHGPRAAAGLSVLTRRGYDNLLLIEGGFAAWQKAGFAVETGA